MQVHVLVTTKGATIQVEVCKSKRKAEEILISSALAGLLDIVKDSTDEEHEAIKRSIFLLKNGAHEGRLKIAHTVLDLSSIEYSILPRQVK